MFSGLLAQNAKNFNFATNFLLVTIYLLHKLVFRSVTYCTSKIWHWLIVKNGQMCVQFLTISDQHHTHICPFFELMSKDGLDSQSHVEISSLYIMFHVSNDVHFENYHLITKYLRRFLYIDYRKYGFCLLIRYFLSLDLSFCRKTHDLYMYAILYRTH